MPTFCSTNQIAFDYIKPSTDTTEWVFTGNNTTDDVVYIPTENRIPNVSVEIYTTNSLLRQDYYQVAAVNDKININDIYNDLWNYALVYRPNASTTWARGVTKAALQSKGVLASQSVIPNSLVGLLKSTDNIVENGDMSEAELYNNLVSILSMIFNYGAAGTRNPTGIPSTLNSGTKLTYTNYNSMLSSLSTGIDNINPNLSSHNVSTGTKITAQQINDLATFIKTYKFNADRCNTCNTSQSSGGGGSCGDSGGCSGCQGENCYGYWGDW